MKCTRFILAIALGAVFFAGCDSPQKIYHYSVVTVMVDNTDISGDRYDVLSKDGLWKLMKGDDSDVYGSINWTYITDVSFNPENSSVLRQPKPKENNLRIKGIRRKFLKDLDSPYHKFLGPCSSTANSSIYRPVSKGRSGVKERKNWKSNLLILFSSYPRSQI